MDAPVKFRTAASPGTVPVDPYRAFIFPNNIRELRRRAGYQKLIGLSHRLPGLTYIRLSKIERGEVTARAHELIEVAGVLGVAPDALLLDADAPGFSIDDWATPFVNMPMLDLERERFAVLLAAAVRHLRSTDRSLTIQAIGERHGIAPVNLSRIENAQRSFEEWNAPTRLAIAELFGTASEATLRARIDQLHRAGELDPWMSSVSDPDERLRRTRERIVALRAELRGDVAGVPAAPATIATVGDPAATIAVRGIAGPDGLVLDQETGERIPPPPGCGAQVIALRLCRATLGAGLPGQAILFIDPDRYPVAGGLAAVRETGGFRILAVAAGMDGMLVGHSQSPQRSLPLNDLTQDEVHAVVAARFV
ncbi:helix-turn-helix domain-containing protein [Sphingomonas sp. R647]|uniref:helix-turn-helix transcriptional regulator n=1 Tax=Sphingomonas sp. R647 TaxID=2875233 RepID=UPI001CD376BD|nr:helix-turn-helix transcriptional regulator [Sphingomonas sp. R647]MCA1198999.1 helix-turn-helix domain-containing protein [Sphingomonas sp. R647]